MSTPEARLTITVPAQAEDLLCALMYEVGETAFQIVDSTTLDKCPEGTARFLVEKPREEAVALLATLENAWNEMDALAEISFHEAVMLEEIPHTDWALTWRKGLEPVVIPPFVIAAHWMEIEPSPQSVILRIDPGMAFGTGLHATTQMAARELIAMSSGGSIPNGLLDLGSGSGILAMIASHLFGCPVHGVEIDSDALEASRDIIRANGFEGKIELFSSIPRGTHYHTIVANINGPALIALRPTIMEHLEPGGRLILTGILSHQAQEIQKTYGLPMEKTVSADEWILFSFQNQ
ncbi:50S ribosomal protein L11 methyltransferase [Myxococcota bacterium]|nr:50S ribosomal protein L11 methyltransferase [Myxococcota bacterium]